jgi:ligand-binding SRPBCC domain-containing protein
LSAGSEDALRREADPLPGYSFSLCSELSAPAGQVWLHATSMAGVNQELAPLVRMTHPQGFARFDLPRMRLRQRLFRSWILLFGLFPIDWDDLCFVAFEPGRRFLERSSMATQRVWEHERTVEPVAGGCRVTDRLRFEPRMAWLGRLQLPLFRLAFALRHRNLRRIFGVLSPPPDASGSGAK